MIHRPPQRAEAAGHIGRYSLIAFHRHSLGLLGLGILLVRLQWLFQLIRGYDGSHVRCTQVQ